MPVAPRRAPPSASGSRKLGRDGVRGLRVRAGARGLAGDGGGATRGPERRHARPVDGEAPAPSSRKCRCMWRASATTRIVATGDDDAGLLELKALGCRVLGRAGQASIPRVLTGRETSVKRTRSSSSVRCRAVWAAPTSRGPSTVQATVAQRDLKSGRGGWQAVPLPAAMDKTMSDVEQPRQQPVRPAARGASTTSAPARAAAAHGRSTHSKGGQQEGAAHGAG